MIDRVRLAELVTAERRGSTSAIRARGRRMPPPTTCSGGCR
ncbi:hypothetical protein ACFQX7_32850 [Luedemannella flava]